jgi:hypothetical protein
MQFPPLKYRIFALIFTITIVILNTFTGWSLPNDNQPIQCVIDSSFTITEEINAFLNKPENTNIINPILIAISLLSDSLLLITGYKWIQNGTNYRFILTIISIYVIKTLFHFLLRLELPHGYLWSYPGFPSITISYMNTNSFFFNGPLCLLTVLAKELYYSKEELIMLLTVFDMLLLGSLLIFLRANYIIDIIFAIIFGDFVYELFKRVVYKEKIFILNDNDNNSDVIDDIEEKEYLIMDKPLTNI